MSRYYVKNGVHYGTADDMIDLIEELEAENAALRKTIEEAGLYYDYEIDCATKGEWAARAKAAESKLAKAVAFISSLTQYAVAIDDRHLHGKAVATLAELVGGKDG